jgi:hypothetical protein
VHYRFHVNYIYSLSLRMLALTRCITHNFSSLDCLVVLYNALIRLKLEYASIV